MIWAEARDGAIGRNGEMPWHLPEDLAHFKEVTLGKPVIMGRRTWESLPERFRPLPGRQNIVVTRNSDYAAAGATVVASLEDAIGAVEEPLPDIVWVLGGGEIYRAAMTRAEVLEVTRIDAVVSDADTRAPEIGPDWNLADQGTPQVASDGTGFRFERWSR